MNNLKKATMLAELKKDLGKIDSKKFLFTFQGHYDNAMFTCYEQVHLLDVFESARFEIIDNTVIVKDNGSYYQATVKEMKAELDKWLGVNDPIKPAPYEYSFSAEVPLIAKVEWCQDGRMELIGIDVDCENYTDKEFIENNEQNILNHIGDCKSI